MSDSYNTFLLIILVLFIYALPIILFFKIWNMTNNVAALKKKYVDENEIAQARVAFMKGDKTRAKDLLDTAFHSEILRLAQKNKRNILTIKYIRRLYVATKYYTAEWSFLFPISTYIMIEIICLNLKKRQ